MENAVGKSLMAPLGTGRISFINRKAEAAEKTAYIAKVYEREAALRHLLLPRSFSSLVRLTLKEVSKQFPRSLQNTQML